MSIYKHVNGETKLIAGKSTMNEIVVSDTQPTDENVDLWVDTSDNSVIPGVTVIDNLESTSTTSPLSANQGRVLNEKIENFEVPDVPTVGTWMPELLIFSDSSGAGTYDFMFDDRTVFSHDAKWGNYSLQKVKMSNGTYLNKVKLDFYIYGDYDDSVLGSKETMMTIPVIKTPFIPTTELGDMMTIGDLVQYTTCFPSGTKPKISYGLSIPEDLGYGIITFTDDTLNITCDSLTGGTCIMIGNIEYYTDI